MIVDDRVRLALDLKSLKLPASPQVLRIDAEDNTDWSGEDAIDGFRRLEASDERKLFLACLWAWRTLAKR